ncbi:hypothetical protein [Streptomyces sp. NL15-2K]|uniref:hypothetical protein n=1 Tax=Streptomyces sp. NL15-2K TaxID=376149 RepID=UPI000F567648|nr:MULTISPECIES: hypothetical protein [Actinomycetes]WKX12525.1 hypothetical protein Q4V64_35375 [Kutzneria buriramensis]
MILAPQTPATRPTASTVAAMLPPPEHVARVRAFFAERGFEVDETQGLSLTLTGPRSAYAETFGEPVVTETGELPLGRLPHEIAQCIDAVVFPEPPGFGPTSY